MKWIIDSTDLCWDGFAECIIPHLMYILYHWAGLVVGVMCRLASLTVQDRPDPAGLSLKFKFTDLWAGGAEESVCGRGRGCVAGQGQLLSCQTDSSSHTVQWTHTDTQTLLSRETQADRHVQDYLKYVGLDTKLYFGNKQKMDMMDHGSLFYQTIWS